MWQHKIFCQKGILLCKISKTKKYKFGSAVIVSPHKIKLTYQLYLMGNTVIFFLNKSYFRNDEME